MHSDIDRVLVTRDQISKRVGELARQIVTEHRGAGEVTLVPILTGAMVFCADLMRQMSLKMRIGVMAVSSYPGQSIRTQGAKVIGSQLGDLHGRHVILLDDILDSGQTLKLVVPTLKALGPASVRTAVLLRKDRPSARAVAVDYVGFEIPDLFVVGYGLDYDDYYRNLPDIVSLKESVCRSPGADTGP